jgi:hypothetical protein
VFGIAALYSVFTFIHQLGFSITFGNNPVFGYSVFYDVPYENWFWWKSYFRCGINKYLMFKL